MTTRVYPRQDGTNKYTSHRQNDTLNYHLSYMEFLRENSTRHISRDYIYYVNPIKIKAETKIPEKSPFITYADPEIQNGDIIRNPEDNNLYIFIEGRWRVIAP